MGHDDEVMATAKSPMTSPLPHSDTEADADRRTASRSPIGNASTVRASATTGAATGSPSPRATSDALVDPPVEGINKMGFIDNSDGANIRTGPAESGGVTVRDQPLPPTTRVFVGGTHPNTKSWWYVTAQLDQTFFRGYVQGLRVNTDLPEPTAKLYQVKVGDTAERLAVQEFSTAIRDGHDLRYYENVLLFVNKDKNRAGVTGAFQDPGLFGGGANNVQLVAGHRIWLVSPAYAHALESVVPSGSLTGGAIAKLKRFLGHIEDILQSIAEAPEHLGEVAGEYAQAIRDHIVEIVGVIAAFVAAEALSMFLATVPTGVTQIAAILIQLLLALLGAKGLVDAGIEAVTHASNWLTLAWTASGDAAKIAAASRELIKMLVSIALAALAYLGVKANLTRAVTIAASLPTGMLPAVAIGTSGRVGSTGAIAPVKLGPPAPAGPFGTSISMMSKVDEETAATAKGPKSEEPGTLKGSSVEEAAKAPPTSAADLLKQLPEEELNRLLSRVKRGDIKGRPFGTPRNPRLPSVEEFNPKIERVKAGDLEGLVRETRHGLFPEQVEKIRTLTNEELVRFRPEDPISAARGSGGWSLTGGHHRLAEIARRVASGQLPRDWIVQVLTHD